MQVAAVYDFSIHSKSGLSGLQDCPAIINFIYIFPTALSMASQAITVGVGIPMIVVGALMAWLWAPTSADLQNQVELVGSTIGILGVVFFISGLFYSKEPVMH